ncbi:MAG TPA: DNA ligase, partial [Candidatus Dormibacteraeota bacterium]|nr:DNA ligase [Candidatus Dormibacteraeota bacterium]
MPDLQDGESSEMQGSGSKPYILKNTGGVYSCTCPAWRNQSITIEKRTCKHLRKLRGDAAEEARIGGALPQRPAKPANDGSEEDAGPPLLLAESWDNATDLTDWWMSEKLDGVRAYWDGKQFLSRQGNIYYAPDWFVEGLPAVPLDGELWLDRKKFQRTVSIVRRQDKSEHWKEIRFLIFDAPAANGGFEERLAFLKDALARGSAKFATQHGHERCKSLEALRAELARIEALQGEGLMLRQPGSKYVAGRSSTLLKVKTFRDAEAVVVGHQPGAGRHQGRLGALLVRLPSGKDFAIGTGFSDREREKPPALGATVTFRYQELSDAGVPRFPSWVGVRVDAPDREPSPARSGTSTQPPARNLQSKPAQTTAAAGGSPTKPRYFEYTDDTSNKFWEVSHSGNSMTTRWGRIGSAGQNKTKTFADEQAVANAVAKLIQEKTDEGYVERR